MLAWNAYKTPRVDLNFICHHLNVNPSVTPKKQPHWRLSRDYSNAVKDKVTKLKQAGAIKEVFYPKWLVNTVAVKKKKWEMTSMYRFHGLKQGLPKRFLPHASNRQTGRCHCRPSLDELLRCLSRIPSNTTSPR